MNDWRGIPRENIPWHPKIDPDKCTGCQTCIEFCRNDVLAFDVQTQKAWVSNPTNCVIECLTCGRLCPSEAISFPDQKEFTDTIRRLLREARTA